MGRRVAADIEVRMREQSPEQFLWKGRLYLVRSVLGRWLERNAWWESGGLPCRPGAVGELELVVPEREVWRVEASRGRCFEFGVYELSCDTGPDHRWQLVQVGD